MLMIKKISLSDFLNYKEEYTKCLKHNADIDLISQIFIFIDAECKDLPIHNKIKYFTKREIRDFDILELSKRISNEEKIVWMYNNLVSFNRDLQKVKIEPNIFKSKDFFVFNRSTKLDNQLATSEAIINLKLNLIYFEKKIYSENINKSIVNNNQTSVRKKGEIVISNPKKEINSSLSVIIISVNYNDYLLLTLSHNINIFSNIIVVTTPEDTMCQKICESLDVNIITTDVMYEDGAEFNKGKAINKAIKSIENPGFILLLDADIIVKDKINTTELDINTLYTSDRWICDDFLKFKKIQNDFNVESFTKYESNKGLGFFQLFHISKEESFPESSNDASFSDLLFRDKFVKRKEINNTLIHLGEAYKNWKGRETKRFIDDIEFTNIFNKIKKYKSEKINTLDDALNLLPYKTESIELKRNNLSNDKEPYIIHVTSKYHSNNKEENRRIKFAESTWKTIYEKDKVIPYMIYQKDNKLPVVKDFFDMGYNLCEKDDDIILYTNSDICLTDNLYEKIVKSCKKYQCTFSFRKDFFYQIESPIEEQKVNEALYSGGIPTPHGADLFAVTKKWWEENKELIPDGQVIARPTWDWIFRIAMGISIYGNKALLEPFEEQGSICETPNISYHERHDSYWEQEENLLDADSIENVKIAYKWMSEKSPSRSFTGKDYFIKNYGSDLFK